MPDKRISLSLAPKCEEPSSLVDLILPGAVEMFPYAKVHRRFSDFGVQTEFEFKRRESLPAWYRYLESPYGIGLLDMLPWYLSDWQLEALSKGEPFWVNEAQQWLINYVGGLEEQFIAMNLLTLASVLAGPALGPNLGIVVDAMVLAIQYDAGYADPSGAILAAVILAAGIANMGAKVTVDSASPVAGRYATKEVAQLSKEAQKGIRSLEKRIIEHERKLADFIANPTPRSVHGRANNWDPTTVDRRADSAPAEGD